MVPNEIDIVELEGGFLNLSRVSLDFDLQQTSGGADFHCVAAREFSIVVIS